jgi:peptidoglycan/xylan/chitin deacetylase (PgdA/CDA1 family)
MNKKILIVSLLLNVFLVSALLFTAMSLFPIPKPKNVVLFFDDGWRNQYSEAYPILRKFGFTATFGIVTDSLSHPTSDYGLTEEEILDLNNHGMEIASHTHSHPLMWNFNLSEIQFELAESKTILEKIIGKVSTFIVPYEESNSLIDSLVFQIYDYERPSGKAIFVSNQTLEKFSSLVKENSFLVFHKIENVSLFEEQIRWLVLNNFKGISFKLWNER